MEENKWLMFASVIMNISSLSVFHQTVVKLYLLQQRHIKKYYILRLK